MEADPKLTDALRQGIDPDELPLHDAHRQEPKALGGERKPGNVQTVEPPMHMRWHGNLREREQAEEDLKAALDIRVQALRMKLKIQNQLLAYERRTDYLLPESRDMLAEQLDMAAATEARCSRALAKAVLAYAEYDRLTEAALGVPGVGPVTLAYCIVYIDLSQARHASSLWKYAGLHVAASKRHVKGKKGGGNKKLRTALYCLAESQVKSRGPYREVYDRVKARLAKSENLVRTRNTQGDEEVRAWKDAKACHRDGAAKRAIMKHFLADYWRVGRELEGLPYGPCYAEAVLGGSHRTVQPQERGWRW